jgi:hypothetical protein
MVTVIVLEVADAVPFAGDTESQAAPLERE